MAKRVQKRRPDSIQEGSAQGRHTSIFIRDVSPFLPEGVQGGEIYPGIPRAHLNIGEDSVVYGVRLKATREEFEAIRDEGKASDVGLEFHQTSHGSFIQVGKSGFTSVSRSEADIIEAANDVVKRVLDRIGRENR